MPLYVGLPTLELATVTTVVCRLGCNKEKTSMSVLVSDNHEQIFVNYHT